MVQLFDCGENLSFFLTAFDMDEFESIVGGVWDVFVDFFYGGVVDTADDIDEWLNVDGLPITCFGFACDELVDVDQIDDGDVDDKLKMA